MDGPQTYRRYNMPVQQIELEEVQMFEVSDAALESASAGREFTGLNDTTGCCFILG
jgi:hypothetical protein